MQEPQRKSQAGFTLIELMLATVIFSIVLIVVLASFLQVGRIYYKGVSVSDTNEATRSVVDDITNDIQLSPNVTAPQRYSNNSASPYYNDYYFCVGNTHRYSYSLSTAADHKVNSTEIASPDPKNDPNGIIRDESGCSDPLNSANGPNAQQLLGANMQLNNLTLSCASPTGVSNYSCNLSIRVVYYGVDDSVLTPSATDPNAVCSGNLLSTQFCSEADFSTNILTDF